MKIRKFIEKNSLYITSIISGWVIYVMGISGNLWLVLFLIIFLLFYFVKTIEERIKEVGNKADQDFDMLGFKLQRIIEFSFEPTVPLLKMLSRETGINVDSLSHSMASQAKVVTLSVFDYTNDLKVFKRRVLLQDTHKTDEWIDYPYENDVPWEVRAAYESVIDRFLFSYELTEYVSLSRRQMLHIGYKVKGEDLRMVVFLENHEANIILLELPIYWEQIEKYSSLNDRFDKTFRMYKSLDNSEDCCFKWKLKIVEHEQVLLLRKEHIKKHGLPKNP